MSYDAFEVLQIINDRAMFGPDIKLDVKHNSKTHYLICVTRGRDVLFSEEARWDIEDAHKWDREGTANFREMDRRDANTNLLRAIIAAGVMSKTIAP